jgi:beta-1,2-mannobiose phosphorylase / 1,2-beta-oligomannan phosphorylase
MVETNFTIPYFLLYLGLSVAIFAVFVAFFLKKAKREYRQFRLKKHPSNPIFSPAPYSEWEGAGVFNPAAIQDDDGNIHLLYRAIGGDGMSRFGYAMSRDGFNLWDKSLVPIFSMSSPRYGQKFDPIQYPSGGSWGGCEDPRMVRIDGRIYLTFNAFDGWDFIRMAVSSIDETDFFDRKWKWSKPMLISPPNQVHKNWVLFPEKIKGKFAILHSVNPEVQIDYVDSLENLSHGIQKINSRHGQRAPRVEWDTWVRGAGPPPIKTDQGWLVLYHAVEKSAPSQYKLGAMLLDLNNPKKIIARSPAPLLCPEEWYENDWKPGIVYASGAVVKGDDLLVYYGGGDKHVCIAHISFKELMDSLLEHGKIN